MIGRDVVDVLLDHDLDQQDDQDVPRGLEEPLVVPFGGFFCPLEDVADPVVLAEEQDVHRQEAGIRVDPIPAHGKQVSSTGFLRSIVLEPGQEMGHRQGEELRRRLAVPIVVGGILFTIDDLRFELPIHVRPEDVVYSAGSVRRGC